MNYCPCCSSPLLQHIRGHEVYWFCRSCWQPMPVYSREKCSLVPELVISKSPIKGKKIEKISDTVRLKKQEALNEWVGVSIFAT